MRNERSEVIIEGEVINKKVRKSQRDGKEYPYFEMLQRTTEGAFIVEVFGDNVEVGKKYQVKAFSRIFQNYHSIMAISVKEIK